MFEKYFQSDLLMFIMVFKRTKVADDCIVSAIRVDTDVSKGFLLMPLLVAMEVKEGFL